MGMTDSGGTVLSYSATGQTRREAKQARDDANKHFEKKETTRYRETIASLGKEAKEARHNRKEQRAEAKRKCAGYVTDAKEKNKDKPPYRRRAELAKARTDCAFDAMNVEEQAAQALEQIDKKRDEEVTRRRSSRTATKNNRARTKERTRTTAREQREEMFDQVRNDLDPGVLPYFEEIKGSAAFRKLVDGGRMTPTEAVLHLAHEDPEAVFAALERQAEKELQELLREQERWEYEGGRLAEGQPAESTDTLAAGAGEPRTEADGQRPTSKPRRAAKGRKAKSPPAKNSPRARRVPTGHPAVKARPDSDQDERDLERFEDEGGRPSPAHEAHAREPAEPRRAPRTRVEGDDALVGLDRDGDDWIAFTWAESQRFKSRSGAVAWLRERGFLPDGTPIGAPGESSPGATTRGSPAPGKDEPEDDDEPPASEVEPPASEVRGAVERNANTTPAEAPASVTPAEAPRPSCGGRCQSSAAAPGSPSPQPKQRLSPEERTGWIPGTEPAHPASSDPAPRTRTTLFEEEDDTLPETPDAKRRHGEPTDGSSAKKRDPEIQQAFGTDFTSWLNQAGPQLTLDSAPVRPAPRVLVQPHSTHASPASPSSPREPAVPTRAPSSQASPPEAVRSPAAPSPSVSAAHTKEAEPPRQSSQQYTGGTLHLDRELGTLQVRFDDMPDAPFRIALRTAGFRWSPAIQRWQAPLTDERRKVAEAVLIEHANVVEARQARRGGSARTRVASPPSEDRPDATRAEPTDGSGSATASDDGAPLDDATEEDDAADLEDAAGEDESDARRNAYEQKRASRVARLSARADKLQAASDAIYTDTRAKADRIPFGQPILVGHHSERRDRRFREKLHQGFGKAFELQSKAEELRRRAATAEKNDAISSDDPDAIAKLSAKVKERGDFIDRARDINEILRAARASRKVGWEPIAVQRMIAIGVAPTEAEKLTQKDFAGRIGIPGYAVKNAQGEIARLNRRIEDLKRRDARPVRAPERIGEAVIVENRDTNRVEIRFDGIPPKELRSHLRGRGFVWAPSVGAWQRKLNDNALWTARDVLRSFYPQNSAEASADAPAPVVMPAREPGLDDEPYVPRTVASGSGEEAVAPF